MMEHIKQNYLSGERALFKSQGLKIENSVFADGESHLKESKNLDINQTTVSYTHLVNYMLIL